MADASTTTGRTAATESASSGDEMNAYVGSLISLMSRSDIRYEGFLYTLNAHDSTIGLSHVRSFGTEGRKKDGPQLPPGDKVYEYILFRGSDIKDLQVKLPPRAKLAVGVHDDTSIIMSQHTTGNSLSQSVKSGGVLMCSNFNHYQPYPRESHEHQSSSQLGLSGHISTGLFSGLPTGDWKEHNGTEVRISPQSQLYSSLYQNTLQSWSEASQVHESSNIGLAKASEYSNFAPQLPPVFLNSTLPPHNICVTDNVPTLVSPASPCQDTNTIVSPIPSVSFASTPVIPLPFGSTSVPGSLLVPPLVPPSTFTPQDYSVHNMKPLVPDMHNLYVDQLNLGVMASTSSGYCPQNVPTQSLTATSMQQSLYCGPIFTEEFDFEAMNEKFKKEDLWGYLGRVKGRDTAADQNMSGRDGLGIKPAYKKDEFFDTISSSLNRGMGNRRNKYQNHPEMNNEWQNGNHESYEAPYGGTSHNWGRGYAYDGRGYGRNTLFDSN